MSDGRWFGMRLVLCFNDRTVRIDGRSNDSDRDVVRFFPQLWSREIGFWTSFYNWVPCIWNPTSPILPKTKMHQTYHNASGKWQILLNAFLSPCPIVRHLRPLPCEVSRQAELSMSNQSINPKSYKWSSCRLMVSEYHLEIMSWLFFFFSLNVIFRCYKWELDGIRVGTGPFWKSESFSQADGVVGWDTHWDPWIGSGP